MKKVGVVLILAFLLFTSLVLAEDETTEFEKIDSYEEKIEKAFTCLEDKVGPNCEDADTVQELALTILAGPENVYNKCVRELKEKESKDHFGSIRDTALAILALKHAGQSITNYVEWILNQGEYSNELTWYIQQDSSTETECTLKYDNYKIDFSTTENKKIIGENNFGSCLDLTSSKYWLKVEPHCYEEEFLISCEDEYIISLLYQNENTLNTFFVSEETITAPPTIEREFTINSKCFREGNGNCEFEDNLWAIYALRVAGKDIEEYLPYLLSSAISNEEYLSLSIIYLINPNYGDPDKELISLQKSGNFWEAEKTRYNRYYDTALALLSLSSTSTQFENAKEWLLNSQDKEGCWGESIQNTAIILWALEQREGQAIYEDTYCKDQGYFCILNELCSKENELNEYHCPGTSYVCCEEEVQESCEDLNGKVCEYGTVCSGREVETTDTDNCCTSNCIKEAEEEYDCEEEGYYCKSFCLESQEETDDYTCQSNKVCCMPKTIEQKDPWWLWALAIGIIVLMILIIFIYREKLKVALFKIKTKLNNGKGKSGSNIGPSSGQPPFPPFPGAPSSPQKPPYNNFPQRGLPPKPTMPSRRPLPMGTPPQRPFPPKRP